MVQMLKDDIRNSIIEHAKEEFMDRGYARASMRSIASAAKITAGNIYRYFKDKDELLSSIVEPVYLVLVDFIKHHDDEVYDGDNKDIDEIFTEQIEVILSIVREMRRELMILMYGCDGSKYEKVKYEFVRFLGESVKDHLDEYYNKKEEKAENCRPYAEAIARSFLEGFFSIIRAYEDSDEMKKYVNEYVKLFFYGFKTTI